MARRKKASNRVSAPSREVKSTSGVNNLISAVSERAPTPSGGVVNTSLLMDYAAQLVTPRREQREVLKAYSTSPWLRTVFSKVSRAVAETQWVLYAAVDNKGRFVLNKIIPSMDPGTRLEKISHGLEAGELVVIPNHPILDMLQRGTGSPRLNGFAAIQTTIAHYDLAGEAYWLLERDNLGIPIGFWPLPPNWVRKLPTEKEPFYEVSTGRGIHWKIPTTEIVPFIDPDPSDPYQRGVGLATSLGDEIDIDEFAAKHQKAFFLNRARPDIIISGPYINREDAKRLEKKWLEEHQGFMRQFKPLFFSQQIDVKELSHNFEQLQMVQVRKQERDTFINVMGAPPEKFGVVSDSKRSTIAAADLFWQKDVLRPRMEVIRRSVQQVIVPMFDERIIFGYLSPVIQDDEFQRDVMRAAPWSAKINEWRKLAHWPSLGEAGEVLAVPNNLQLIPVKNEAGEPRSAQEMADAQLAAVAGRGNGGDAGISESEFMLGNMGNEVILAVGQLIDRAVEEIVRKGKK